MWFEFDIAVLAPAMTGRLFRNRMGGVLMGQSNSFAGSLSEEVELCSSGLSASNRLYIDDVGRVKREDAFDTFAAYHPAYGEHFIDPTSLAGDYRAVKNLDTFLLAFFDLVVDVNDIADFEIRHVFFQALAFDGVKQFGFHEYSPIRLLSKFANTTLYSFFNGGQGDS